MAEIERVALMASGAAMVLLATLLLAVGNGRAVHRAFAALVAVRGAGILLQQASSDPRWQWGALGVQPYFALAMPLLAAYLYATTLPGERRVRMGRGALAALAVVEIAYLIEHDWFQTLATGTAAIGALRAAPGVQYVAFGPLAAVAALGPFALAALGLRYAVLYRRAPDGPQATTTLLVATALLVGGLFDGANRLSALANLLDGVTGFPWLPWGWAVLLLPVTALAPALLGVAVVASGRTLDPRPQHRVEGLAIVLCMLAFFTGFVRLVAPPDSDVGGHPLVLVLLGLWRLAMPALVAYALLRREPAPAGLPTARPQGLDA